MKKFRSFFPMAFLAFMCILMGFGAAEDVVPVTGIRLAANKITVFAGQSSPSAAYSVLPDNATNKKVLWSSDDKTIATVDQNGIIIGVKAGDTKIHITAEDTKKGTKTAVINVKVVQPVKSISLDLSEIRIGVGTKAKAKASVFPNDATNKKVTWTTADKNIAQVSADGTITGRGTGVTKIICEAQDGSGIKAEITASVYQPVKSLQLNQKQLTAYVGKKSAPLVCSINPATAAYQTVTWSSSDESVATVNDRGEVTGIKGGTVIITATSNEPVTDKKFSKTATCKVQVIQAVEYISLEKNVKKSTDRKLVLTLKVLPESATNKKVTWKSSDKKVAVVKNGVVTIKRHEGKTTITATANDGSGLSASCDVDVGFSGIFMQFGSYVYREGAYTWDVSNFVDSTGTKEPQSDSSEV